jgi:hypothetical protein
MLENIPDTVMDYTTLSLAEVGSGLADIVRETEAAFGRLDARQPS